MASEGSSIRSRVSIASVTRGAGGSVSHAFQVALPGLVRIRDFVLRAGLDIERLYGRIRKPTARYDHERVDLEVQSKSEQLTADGVP